MIVTISKRQFLKATVAAGVGAAIYSPQASADDTLTTMTGDAQPITVEERLARVQKAQRLMEEHDVDALLIEAGSALVYFTGVRWGRSERFTGVIIPRQGDIAFVTPYFEEPTVRERMTFGDDVRTWHEDESPFDLVAGILSDRGLRSGRIGVEETVRHFISDGVRQAAPRFEMVSGKAVTRGCRMFKSAAEVALMQIANNVTLRAYRHVYANVELGMQPSDISAIMNEATRKLGATPRFASALVDEASAYPHGSRQPQVIKENSVLLMDCGCDVHDYKSDISRTWVIGEPTRKVRRVWETAKRGQELALETAKVGVPAGLVDDVVREFYAKEGFGPDYRTPGLSHRLGHGIGMDGHEPINFVRGETTRLQPGMCFSNEPGIYIFGEFGVRLEDCLTITEEGPRLFTDFSPSIDRPFG